jgi:predicted nucleic acid-binding Zn ribbon protein
MSFNSLDRILEILQKQPGWETQQQYRHLLQCWETAVAPKVAQHARPLYIARNVLSVATSSSVWAQNLSLQRYSLLLRLNPLLSEPLVDIRFSCAQWHNINRLRSDRAIAQEQHPSAIEMNLEQLPPPLPQGKKTPQEAFQRWAAIVEARSRDLPVCPRCQCPTPVGELERWAFCSYCAAKQWSSERQKPSV